MSAGARVPRLVTVDGVAGSGKSTLSRRLARALGVPYLYTGAWYRAATWLAQRRGVRLDRARDMDRLARGLRVAFRSAPGGGQRVLVNGTDATEALQTPEISALTSRHTASYPALRARFVAQQRRALGSRGLVAEGRDCGSVVFPSAPFKFYLTTSVEARARRRIRDFARAGIRESLARLRADLARRDLQDAREDLGRGIGALRAVPDAWIIDNSALTPSQALAAMLRRIRGA